MSFNLWGLEIYYYGVIIAAGVLTAFLVALFIFKKIGYKEEVAYLILLVAVPLGIVCARAYYVIFSDWSNYHSFLDVINIRAGGMAIYGGVLGGALGVFIVSRIKKVGLFTIGDICVMVLILAQSIGRWGNFVNQEAYGITVAHSAPPFTVFIDADGKNHLATFFLESILNLIGFAMMMVIFFRLRKSGKYKWGTMTALYLIWYGIVRAIVEPFRTDSLLMFGSSEIIFNRVSFMLSIALIVLGVLLLWATKKGWTSQENKACLKNKSPEQEKTNT